MNFLYDFSSISVPPSFTTRPNNQTVIEGTNVTFLCTATGNPTPTIKWMKDGKSVAKGETLSFKTSRNDSGEYRCLAENGLGEVINTTAYLDVQCKFGKVKNEKTLGKLFSLKKDHDYNIKESCLKKIHMSSATQLSFLDVLKS